MSTHCYTKLPQHEDKEQNIEISQQTQIPIITHQETKTEHIKTKNNIIIKQTDNNISFANNDVYIVMQTNRNLQQIISPQIRTVSEVKKNKISKELLFLWCCALFVMYYIIVNDIVNNDTINRLTVIFFPYDIAIIFAYIIKKYYKQSYVRTFMSIFIFFGLCPWITIMYLYCINFDNNQLFPFIVVIIKLNLGIALMLY